MRIYKKVLDLLNAGLEKVVIALMIGLVIAVFLQVLSRVFLLSLSWIEELVRYMLIYLAILGSAVVTYSSNMINMDVLLKILPKKSKRVVEDVGALLAISCSATVIIGSFDFIRIGMNQISPSLLIKMGYIYLMVPIGFGMILINIMTRLLERWGCFK